MHRTSLELLNSQEQFEFEKISTVKPNDLIVQNVTKKKNSIARVTFIQHWYIVIHIAFGVVQIQNACVYGFKKWKNASFEKFREMKIETRQKEKTR